MLTGALRYPKAIPTANNAAEVPQVPSANPPFSIGLDNKSRQWHPEDQVPAGLP